LKARFDALKKEEQEMADHVKDIDDLYRMVDKRTKKTALRYSTLQLKQKDLYQKLLLIMSKIEVMRNRNQPMTQDELR